jgi:RNA polymerase sigma-70 factor (ECF subfamily)
MDTPHGRIDLILRAQAGDRQALDQLLRGLQDRLYAYLVGLVGDRHLAEDVLQEVFVLIWRKLFWLRDPHVFRAWVYRIASREAFRRLRRERPWWRLLGQGRDLAEAAAEEVVEPIPPEWRERLPALLDGLSPGSRAVLMLHYLEGLSLAEVAGALSLSAGTVKSRLAYGLAALRRRVAGGGPPHPRVPANPCAGQQRSQS